MQGDTNDDLLEKHGINRMGEKFFVQRWFEILNDLTHDSYHIKHLNSVIALKEIIEVCEGIISGEIKLQAIESPIKGNATNNKIRSLIG